MNPKFERILAEPTASIPEAGAVLGMARNASYEAVKRGEIPVLRFGTRYRVSTAILRKMLLEGINNRPQTATPAE